MPYLPGVSSNSKTNSSAANAEAPQSSAWAGSGKRETKANERAVAVGVKKFFFINVILLKVSYV